VEVEPHDWARVTFVNIVLVKAGFRSRAVVTICLINVSLFGADPESGGFVVGEIEGCDCHFASLVVTRMYEL
jgi:hypothetical protein